MSDRITKLARGERCTVRLPGCDGGGDTTVLAHYRSVRLGAGMGHKPNSIIGAHACFSCHNILDGRTKTKMYSDLEIRLAHAEACLETIGKLWMAGEVKL